MRRIATTMAGLCLVVTATSAPLSAAQAEPEDNQPPLAPTEVDIDYFGRNCGDFVSGLPRMRARLTDPDGDLMRANYRAARVDNGSWTALGTDGETTVTSGSVSARSFNPAWAKTASGAWIQTKYRWTVGAVEAETEPPLSGPRSEPCDFILDMADPKLTIASATATVPGGGTVSLPHDGWLPDGSTIKVVLDPAGSKGYGGVNDVDKYGWVWWSDPPVDGYPTVDPVKLGAKGVLTIDTSDLSSGPRPLTVWSVDRAGRWSEPQRIDINVGWPDLYADYAFDEELASTSAIDGRDDGARASTFHLSGGATRSVNVADQNHNLSLDGSSGTAVSGSPVVRPPTNAPTRAFSVGAWARPSDVTRRQVLLSQVNDAGTVFSLGIRPCVRGTRACSFFTLHNPALGQTHSATSLVPVRQDEWVYLAASYTDFTSQGRRIRVSAQYPDASFAPGVTKVADGFVVPSLATGHTRIGSETAGDLVSSYWAGHVDELRFFRGELSGNDIRQQMIMGPPDGPLAP